MCQNLRLLLTVVPILGENLKLVPLLGFLYKLAPRHGFKMIQHGEQWELWNKETGKILAIHEADSRAEKGITGRVVKNLHLHRDELRQVLAWHDEFTL